MPIVILDAADADAPARAADAASALAPGTPVVALVHGYRYAPGRTGSCPGESLYADGGWPRRLALREALLVGVSWNARGTIWQAWDSAARAGARLAEVMAAVGRPVDAVAHSLGARVALAAAAQAPAGSAGRLILLAAAAFRGEARAALATPGGAAAEIINVTSRENDLFDALLVAAMPWRGRPLGRGLGEGRRNWVDVAIDRAATRAALGRLGYPIATPERRFCHRSGYLRRGLFPFYADLLRDRALLPLPLVAGMLADPADAADQAVAPPPLRWRAAWR
jgi:hypothetical protein